MDGIELRSAAASRAAAASTTSPSLPRRQRAAGGAVLAEGGDEARVLGGQCAGHAQALEPGGQRGDLRLLALYRESERSAVVREQLPQRRGIGALGSLLQGVELPRSVNRRCGSARISSMRRWSASRPGGGVSACARTSVSCRWLA